MRISDWSSDVCSSDLLAIAAKCAAISPCAFLLVIRKFGGAVNRWILSCQQDFSGLGPQTLVSGKADTASDAGGWTFSRFIDRKPVGQGQRVSGRVELGWCRSMKKKKSMKGCGMI